MGLLRKYDKEILAAVLIAMIVIPFLLIAFFAFPHRDDYAYSMMLSSDISELFSWDSVKYAVSAIISNGYALNSFLTILFSPLRYFGFAGIRLTIFFTNTLFLISCFIFIKGIVKGIFKDTKPLHWMIAYLLYILAIIAFSFQAQIFSWAVCSTCYVLPIICLHFGLACFIKASLTSQKRFWLASALFGMLGTTGPMNVSALVCGLYSASLLLLIINRKYSKWALISVLAAIAVGVLPLFFSGIYSRRNSISSQYNWMATLTLTVNAVLESAWQLLRSPVAPILCLFAVLTFRWVSSSQKVRWMNLAVVTLTAVLGPIIVMFPYFLGYGSGYFPPRAEFIMEFTIIICLLVFIVGFSAFAKSRIGQVSLLKKAAIPLCLVFALFCGSIALAYDWKECMPVKVVQDVADGQLVRTYQYWTKTIAKWEESEGKDVLILDIEQNAFSLPYLLNPDVTCFWNDWGNIDLSRYYHLNSICLVSYVDYMAHMEGQ